MPRLDSSPHLHASYEDQFCGICRGHAQGYEHVGLQALLRDLDALPKVDQHCHIEGAKRPATVVGLAGKIGISLCTGRLVKRRRAKVVMSPLLDQQRARWTPALVHGSTGWFTDLADERESA
jgi:hypothetical protein